MITAQANTFYPHHIHSKKRSLGDIKSIKCNILAYIICHEFPSLYNKPYNLIKKHTSYKQLHEEQVRILKFNTHYTLWTNVPLGKHKCEIQTEKIRLHI